MKTVNIAELKNKLSAYLELVEQGEEIVIRNRQKSVGRIIPAGKEPDEEEALVLEGKLVLPQKQMSKKFLDDFLKAQKPKISGGTSVDAVVGDRHED